jgi:hypothetical protein
MCFWISFIVILDKNEEVPCSALLKKAHQRRLQSLHISRRNLVDLIEYDDRNKVSCTSRIRLQNLTTYGRYGICDVDEKRREGGHYSSRIYLPFAEDKAPINSFK